jgi:DNA-binding LacI/PurR family transcriptional regulator
MKKKASGSRVTLKDIAQAMGLHHSSVSLALRHSPEISVATRERIMTVARSMGYEPNPMAAGLAQFRRSSKTVPVQATLAWINAWPDPKKLRSYREFDLYWKGASMAAEKLGYRLEEFIANKEMPLSRIDKTLRARGITGILIPPYRGIKVDWGPLNWERFSAVRLGRSVEALPFHLVTADQGADSVLAFQKMRQRGYQRIGFVGQKGLERVFVAGFLQVQLEEPKSLRVPPLLLVTPGSRENQKLFLAWLEKNKPDAIFTEIQHLPRWLAEAGYRVPEDIGLAGTTAGVDVAAGLDQHPEEIGRVAVLVLTSLIHDNDRGTPPIHREILIKGEWVDGSSLPSRR